MAQAADRQRVHAVAKKAEHRREECQGVDDRGQDDERARDADGPDRRRFEQEQPGQPDGDGDTAERDRLAGGGHRPFDRLAHGAAAS